MSVSLPWPPFCNYGSPAVLVSIFYMCICKYLSDIGSCCSIFSDDVLIVLVEAEKLVGSVG